GNFESYLISPQIDVAAEAGGNVSMVFDSSWRPEGNQKGNLTVSFDGGAAQELLLLSTGTTQDNETNAVKVLSISIPA
ncbi:MAG: alkaline phosphatase family protein, partial [Verrucomicrobiales bacterium]